MPYVFLFVLVFLLEGVEARIYGTAAQLFFNAKQAVVFSYAFTSVRSTGFNLVRIQSDCQVGNGGIFRFAGTVGNDGSKAGVMSHLNGVERFRKGPDLVEFNKDRVSAALSNALGKTLCVRNEEVVAYELNLISEYFRHMLPTFPVFFIQAVFNGINRIFFDCLPDDISCR